MTIVVLNYLTNQVAYHTLSDNHDSTDIEYCLTNQLGYSLNNIDWMVTNPITCESCRFWANHYADDGVPAHCAKGVRGTVTELLEFGCTLHQPKD
jgi:hypothetical protein